MDFKQEARERLRRELPNVKGAKENAIKHAVMEALSNFAGQDEEFAQAIAQGGSFSDCMAAVCKGIGTSISDLEAYRRAAAFYFPGCDVRFEMRIELAPGTGDEGTDCHANAAALARNDGESAGKSGMVIDLADFL